jgi:hypothetical protein
LLTKTKVEEDNRAENFETKSVLDPMKNLPPRSAQSGERKQKPWAANQKQMARLGRESVPEDLTHRIQAGIENPHRADQEEKILGSKHRTRESDRRGNLPSVLCQKPENEGACPALLIASGKREIWRRAQLS